MFRHKEGSDRQNEEKKRSEEHKEENVEKKEEKAVSPAHHSAVKEGGDLEIKELLEKNLKWSQIIYEQNRRINRKLVWAAVASWFRLFLILIPLLLALWFLPPYIRQIAESYSSLFNFSPETNSSNTAPNTESVESLLKVLPLSEVQKEQIRAMMK